MKAFNENRIDKKFALLRSRGEKALITYATAGDPDLNITKELVLAMESSGADIIELGIPYSDPIADGPVIQEASIRALENGAKITNIMNTVGQIRENSQIPLIYLVYYNSIFRYGVERFMSECSAAGIDGVIIPDLPIEERDDINCKADYYGIHIIPLVAPTSKERIKKITERARGFVYCVSANGVTGIRSDIGTDISEYMNTVSFYTDIPKALGFGISGAEMAKQYKDFCEGIIVGSAIVKEIAGAKTKETAINAVSSLVHEIKEAIK